jgi:hypothetical protein
MDLVFWIQVFIRGTFAITEVVLSTTIIFSKYSHNMRFSASLLFPKQEMICCSAYPTLMMCTLSVLDFIFMMILFMRYLTFFMRCSLHENGGVCTYFHLKVYTKLESIGILRYFSLIVYNI